MNYATSFTHKCVRTEAVGHHGALSVSLSGQLEQRRGSNRPECE
jgi:hypothetical protein